MTVSYVHDYYVINRGGLIVEKHSLNDSVCYAGAGKPRGQNANVAPALNCRFGGGRYRNAAVQDHGGEIEFYVDNKKTGWK